jgi:exopolyphosphatase/guanosine-5'-triphosphate,3'-diphosphate pyrophosphatase
LRRHIQRKLSTVPWLDEIKGLPMVGQGGTIRNLAKMATRRIDYPLSSLHGYRFTRDELREDIRQLIELPLAQRRKISGLSSDRADIILPGALVFDALLDALEIDSLTISHNGLREGLFFEHFWHHLSYPVVDDVRRFTIINLARNYFYQKNHAGHVRYLAGRLFDQLAPLHDYGRQERELLEAAALLHDLGTVISYYGHHKHSQTLIINSGLPGFAPRETALIALLTRYHRKGTPSTRGFEAILEQGDEERLQRLAAILRLAEFLERGRNATVDDVTASWSDDSLRLTLLADEYPAVELWEAERNAVDLVAEAFGRAVTIESSAAPESWT